MRCAICDCGVGNKCQGEVTWSILHKMFLCEVCRDEIYGSLAEFYRDPEEDDVEGFGVLEIGDLEGYSEDIKDRPTPPEEE